MQLTRLIVLIPCVTGACMTVRPVVAPASFVTQRQPEIVWVNAADHADQTIPLARPTVVGDSLHGQWLGTGDRVSLNLSRVTSMVARQPDRRRTALLVAGAALVAGFVVWRSRDDSGLSSGCVFDPRSGWYCP
jgi:hypothetical protein